MNRRLETSATTLPGVTMIQRAPITDERGWLERMYDTTELAEALGTRGIAQVNRTLTRSTATIRGLHFQVQPSAEGKIVSCLRGAIFDVAVDLRRGSSTFLRWHGETLSEENRRSLLIPEGFAHGFQALVDDCELLYFHTAAYDPAKERGLNPLDPRVGIAWPLTVGYMSDRDRSLEPIEAGFEGIVV
jgi:dTDP-4-dehydrorhamnose 3,5-epimerase